MTEPKRGSCKDMEQTLSGLIDAQLTREEKAVVEAHLSACGDCREALAGLKRVDAVLKEHAPKESIPHPLRDRILDTVRLEKIESLLESRPARRAWAPAIFASALAALVVMFWLRHQAPSGDLAEAAIVNHLHSLSGGLPAEIQSDDPGKVAAWFAGKLPFRVEAPDLSRRGFALTGGRLCHLKGQDVAYLIYKGKDHALSIFATDCSRAGFPVKEGERPMLASIKGFCAACWRKGGIGFVLVGDLGEKKVQQLAQWIQTQAG